MDNYYKPGKSKPGDFPKKRFVFKQVLFLIFTLCLLQCGLFCVGAGAAEGDTVLEISDAGELLAFAERVNAGETDLDAVLTADIVLNEGEITRPSSSATVWTPIGSNDNSYAGTFDGQGYSISGLYFNNTNGEYVGLFGCTAGEAVIKNVGIVNSYISGNSGDSYVGAVCGYNGGTITGCYNTGLIYGIGYIGNGYTGGISGYNTGTITDCRNIGTVSGGDTGGICGYNEGRITDCCNTGSINGGDIAGICGINYGTISECCNTGEVFSYVGAGGICCNNHREIKDCYNAGTVGEDGGGICNQNLYSGTITGCYNTGTVSGTYIGAICYSNRGSITNCCYLSGTGEKGIDSGNEGEAVEKTAQQFASGEVCYLLNGSSGENPVWYQSLRDDDYPVFDSSHGTVYLITAQFCPGYFGEGYSNSPDGGDISGHSHTYNEDGYCIYCGDSRPPETGEGGYQISDYRELLWFADYVNAGNTTADAVLTADIIANEGNVTGDGSYDKVWTPIGDSANMYVGTFDGQGYTISGLYYNDTAERYVGLFGYADEGAVIRNVGIINSYMGANQYVAGICGRNYGSIYGCYSEAIIYAGTTYAGGICGRNSAPGTITGCYNTGSVTGGYAGGICSYNESGITDCYSTGSVSGSNVGVLCGYSTAAGSITGCYYLSSEEYNGIGSGDGEAIEKSTDEFASGHVCYLLEGSDTTGDMWRQNIGSDAAPVLDSSHSRVYLTSIQYCPGYTETSYNNTADDIRVLSEEHEYDQKGICIYCGEFDGEPEYDSDLQAYVITSYGELLWFADYVNSGNTAANAVLAADITVNGGSVTAESTTGEVWTPIGASTNMYAGTFDGQGHTISGLYFNDDTADYAGLFGCIYSGAQIRNVNVAGSYFKGGSYAGAVCGYNNYGDITGCTSSSVVEADTCAGGIAGRNHNGSITACSNSGTVTGNNYAGGISGYNYQGSIEACYSRGTVSSTGYAGGICGYTSGNITDCFYLRGSADDAVGNIIVENSEKTVTQFASGEVAYLLNGSSSENPMWYQTLGSDDWPVLDSSHGRVYRTDSGYTNTATPAGDVNGDGVANEADAGLILKYVSGIIPAAEFGREYNITAGDYNNDSYVDIADVIAILAV